MAAGAMSPGHDDPGLTQAEEALRDLDPSLREGWRIIFERECPFEMRLQQGDEGPQEVGTLEAIRAKVLVLGDPSEPTAVKMELSSENDLFFHYTHSVQAGDFPSIQEEQKLMIEFADYSKVLCQSLNSAIREPHSHLAVFVMHRDAGTARLDFIQNMEYKFVELLSCDFMRSAEECVRDQITYRYNALKSRLSMMQAQLHDVQKLVQAKNPSLLLQLQQKPGGGGGGGGKQGDRTLGSTGRSHNGRGRGGY